MISRNSGKEKLSFNRKNPHAGPGTPGEGSPADGSRKEG